MSEFNSRQQTFARLPDRSASLTVNRGTVVEQRLDRIKIRNAAFRFMSLVANVSYQRADG
jgi:hypothetical protein